MPHLRPFFMMALGITFVAALTFAARVNRAFGADGSLGPHHKGTLSSINVGARYSSLLANRGVVFYRDFQVDPIFAVFMFDDRLEFLGDSIGYRDFIGGGDSVRLRTRLQAITDKPLFPAHETITAGAPSREDTYEWHSRVEIFFPGYNSKTWGEINIGYSKDLAVHGGNYVDVLGKLKVVDFRLPVAGTLVELNAFGSLGWGDGNHNHYFYGPAVDALGQRASDEAGVSNYSYGLWFAFPEEADRNYPIVQLTRFEVLGDSRRSADFARGRNEGWLLSFIATVGLLEGRRQ